MRPLIALLTDFGRDGPYVASMKGVVLSICPDATIVDVSHTIRPQSVLEGALTLDAVCPWFPDTTVFVAVVDPGVGTTRRSVALESRGRRFVAPDNGLLTGILRQDSGARAVELTVPAFWREPVSATFEGRDRFAPAAAWLARGVRLEALGPPVDGLVRLEWPAARVGDEGTIVGELVWCDTFGNVMSSIDVRSLACGQHAPHAGSQVFVEGLDGALPFVRTYGDLQDGQFGALVGSAGWLEVCVGRGHAVARLGAWAGRSIRVSRPRD